MSMDARARIGAIALLALAPAACAQLAFLAAESVDDLIHPRFNDTLLQTPKLSPLTADEKTMDCAQLDLALDRAETVRWLTREDGGQLRTRGWRNPPNHPDVFLDAADGRIRELLQQKRSRDCRPRATAIADMDDAALLRALDWIQVRLDAGGDEAMLLEVRTRLLDNLRVVPAPAARKDPP